MNGIYGMYVYKNMFLLLFLPSVVGLRTDWECMHGAGVDEMKEIVHEYLESFPCEECREHFNEMMETHWFPLEHVTTDEEARIWSWLTHNIVNKRIGKSWEPYSIMDKYSGTCET